MTNIKVLIQAKHKLRANSLASLGLPAEEEPEYESLVYTNKADKT